MLSIDECIYQYKLSTLVFLPSLLEVFSATYLEAMAMRVPIVTSDMPFAREICQDAAIYVDTRDVEKCANSISEILSNNKLFSRSIIESEEMFMRYPDPDERLKIILRMFEQVKQHSKLKPSS